MERSNTKDVIIRYKNNVKGGDNESSQESTIHPQLQSVSEKIFIAYILLGVFFVVLFRLYPKMCIAYFVGILMGITSVGVAVICWMGGRMQLVIFSGLFGLHFFTLTFYMRKYSVGPDEPFKQQSNAQQQQYYEEEEEN